MSDVGNRPVGTDLGEKHECAACGVKFYDLGKPEAICPKCGANQAEVEKAAEAAPSRRKRKRATAKKTEKPEAEPAPEGEPTPDLDTASPNEDQRDEDT